jgi:hypothetical protein
MLRQILIRLFKPKSATPINIAKLAKNTDLSVDAIHAASVLARELAACTSCSSVEAFNVVKKFLVAFSFATQSKKRQGLQPALNQIVIYCDDDVWS